MALYTDRPSWAVATRRAGEPIDQTRRTQVQRALKRLGILAWLKPAADSFSGGLGGNRTTEREP